MNDTTNGKNLGMRRLQLLLIMGIVIVPVVASYFMFYTGIGIPTETVNHGELVENPLQLSVVSLTDEDNQPWAFAEQGLVFHLLQVVDGDCADACRELLYLSRQVNIRLGKNGAQLQRVLVQTSEPSLSFLKLLDDEYPNLVRVSGQSDQWRHVLSSVAGGGELNGERVYVVDRRGFLVMYYTPSHTGGEMLEDLNHLIKTVQ